MDERGFDLESRVGELDSCGRRHRLAPADRVAERAYFAAPPGGELPVLEREDALVFGSDNYLGLTADQRVQNAARQAAYAVGTGSGSSRILAGDTLVHHDLERLLAETTGTERALTFASGYAANAGAVSALEPDVVFADERSHESVLDGCRRSQVEMLAYDHRDTADLDAKLARRSDGVDRDESWLVVTPSVFGMDGTVAPLSAICDAAENHGAWVMVDETHATGLYANGGGVAQAEGVSERIHLQTGTLSKALASQGGYVAGSEALIEWLVNRARSIVHSAGLAPTAAASASEALHVSRHDDHRDRLWDNVAHLRDGLEAMGFEVLGDSQILPVVVGDRNEATSLADAMATRRVVAPAVGPPFVSGDDCRIRVTPMATHDDDDIVACLEAFQEAGEEVGLL